MKASQRQPAEPDSNQVQIMYRPLSFEAFASIAARTLMSVLFLASGTTKLTSTKAMQEYMEAYGVPGYLVYPAAALELTSGTMLILGVMLMELGVVLSGWCLLTASIFHRDWQGDDGQTQQLMFMKNLCMAGGFLVLASTPHESRSFGTIRQWMKEKLSSNGKEHTSPGEHTNLLPKHLPPSPLYGGERRAGQIV